MSTTPGNDIRLSRRYRFSASHRLYSDELSEAENRAIFGKCAKKKLLVDPVCERARRLEFHTGQLFFVLHWAYDRPLQNQSHCC